MITVALGDKYYSWWPKQTARNCAGLLVSERLSLYHYLYIYRNRVAFVVASVRDLSLSQPILERF